MKTPLTKLFGTSGIRGIANRDITPQLVIKVGQALTTYKKARTVLIAHDSRTTSQMLQRALTAGITACGAWINPSFCYCPDGILSSALLLEALEKNNQSMSEFVSGVPRYPLLRENIVCADSIKHTVVKRGYKTLLSIFPDVTKHSKVDGFRLTLSHSWLLIRPSGTEPSIRITVEAETRKTAEAVMRKATKLMNKLVKEESQ